MYFSLKDLVKIGGWYCILFLLVIKLMGGSGCNNIIVGFGFFV